MKKVILLACIGITRAVSASDTMTPQAELSLAIYRSDFATLSVVLSSGGVKLDQVDEQSQLSPLMLAASIGDTEMVSSILRAGANPNFQNAEGMSALMIAASRGHTKVIELLLNAGAKADLRDQAQLIAVDFARTAENLALAPLLLANRESLSTLESAKQVLLSVVDAGNLDALSKVLSAITLPEVPRSNLIAYLGKRAIESKNLKILELLIKQGKSANLVNYEDGYSWIHYAAMSGHFEAASLLIRNGADKNRLAPDRNRPIHFAINNRDEPMMRLLSPEARYFHMADDTSPYGYADAYSFCRTQSPELDCTVGRPIYQTESYRSGFLRRTRQVQVGVEPADGISGIYWRRHPDCQSGTSLAGFCTSDTPDAHWELYGCFDPQFAQPAYKNVQKVVACKVTGTLPTEYPFKILSTADADSYANAEEFCSGKSLKCVRVEWPTTAGTVQNTPCQSTQDGQVTDSANLKNPAYDGKKRTIVCK